MTRWGILGAGNIAHRFAASLQNIQGDSLYAISGRNPAKLQAFCEQYPCEKQYVGHENLLQDENVDAIYLALPHSMHKAWAVQALNAHKPVLCEKPCALNEEEVKEITACAEANHTLFMEAMKARFTPAYAKVCELAENNAIGRIHSITAVNCFLVSEERLRESYYLDPVMGGVLLDSGCYGISWLSAWMKQDINVRKVYVNFKENTDVYVDAYLLDQEGTQGHLTAAFDRKGEQKAVLTGTFGSLTITPLHRPKTIILKSALYPEGKTYEIPYDGDDFTGEITHFDRLMKEGKTESPVMSFADSLRCAGMSDQIRAYFRNYTDKDLQILAAQERAYASDCWNDDIVMILGDAVVNELKYYDRGIAIRIIRESDQKAVYEYVAPDKSERNLRFCMWKKKALETYGHSSAWAYVKHVMDPDTEMISAGAFPLLNSRGHILYSVLVSGLHEGKDHEIILRGLEDVTGVKAPDFPKALV